MAIPSSDDAQSWERFYQTYRPLIFLSAYRVLRDTNDAEDVVQTTLLKTWLRPWTFRQGNLEGWLSVSAKNCALDRLRRQRHQLVIEQATLDRPPAGNTVEAAVVRAMHLAWLDGAVGSLTQAERDLLRAAYYSGLSHRRIAREWNLPLGTVKSRIRNTLLRLRRQAERQHLRVNLRDA